MAVKLGTSNVTLKLGTQSVTGYLGSAIVTATVPGAPTIDSAMELIGDVTLNYSAPESDGGSAITGYIYYVNGVPVTPTSETPGFSAVFPGQFPDVIEVSAVNAVGEGPKSAPVTVP